MSLKHQLFSLVIFFSSLQSFANPKYQITKEDQKQLNIAAHDYLHPFYQCDQSLPSHSEVKIDHATKNQAFGQVYYYCIGSEEKMKDEYCDFSRDSEEESWFAEYCDH